MFLVLNLGVEFIEKLGKISVKKGSSVLKDISRGRAVGGADMSGEKTEVGFRERPLKDPDALG